jgi:hypothetical protein
MATTPRRTVKTPGATETTTPDPAALAAETTETESTTGTVSEPVAAGGGLSSDSKAHAKSEDGADVQYSTEDSRLDLILENQKRIENKLDQLLKAGGIETPKKKRWVQGKNGLEHKEV